MQEYTITRIVRQEKVAKASGKPYTSVGLQVQEFGAEWINGFGNKENANWKEGDKVTMKIFDETYNGKVSKKFEVLKPADLLTQEINGIKVRLNKHHTFFLEIAEKINKICDDKGYPEEKINPEDIPF